MRERKILLTVMAIIAITGVGMPKMAHAQELSRNPYEGAIGVGALTVGMGFLAIGTGLGNENNPDGLTKAAMSLVILFGGGSFITGAYLLTNPLRCNATFGTATCTGGFGTDWNYLHPDDGTLRLTLGGITAGAGVVVSAVSAVWLAKISGEHKHWGDKLVASGMLTLGVGLTLAGIFAMAVAPQPGVQHVTYAITSPGVQVPVAPSRTYIVPLYSTTWN